jgi:hypothetical protein
MGAAQLPLFAILGSTMWDGYPIATARVILPMLFCFNLFVPPARRFWPVLVLGNLSVISGYFMIFYPPR